MAVSYIPHGRRAVLGIAQTLDPPAPPADANYTPYPLVGAAVMRRRNLIVPPVHSRDWAFLYSDGVRFAQIQLRILCMKHNAGYGLGMDAVLLDWIMGRKPNGDSYAASIRIYDGNATYEFHGCKVQTAQMVITKGDLIIWNIVVQAVTIGTQLASNPAQLVYPQFAETPLTWRDVLFVSSGSPSIGELPIYSVEFTVANNLVMNAPIAEGADNFGVAIARWDGGQMQASATITLQYHTDSQLASLYNPNGFDFGVRFATPSNRFIRFPKLVAENPIDLPINYGPMFRQVQCVALGTLEAGASGVPPIYHATS
jgi:hypothetical protein